MNPSRFALVTSLAILGATAALACPCVEDDSLSPKQIANALREAEFVVLDFSVSDPAGKPLGSFRLALTKEPAETCLDGNFLEATPISWNVPSLDLATWWRDRNLWPAYEARGRLLDVELNGGAICDNYLSVRAELDDSGGNGYLESSGWGSKRLGSVKVTIVKPSTPTETSK